MKKHILVVDKDQLILYALSKALKDEGCVVNTAETATEAMEKLSDWPYDLCLLDIQIAKADSTKLNRIIKDICPETKVIMMTADSLNIPEAVDMHGDTIAPGPCYFILKPFALCDITEVVRQVLDDKNGDLAAAFFFTGGKGKKSRKHPRSSCNDEVGYRVSAIKEGVCARLSMKAQVVDISDGGVGLLTSYPLRETQVISFDEKMHNRIGVVAWSRMIDGKKFRVGIRFA